MKFNKYFSLIFGFFFVLSFELGAMSLSDEKFNNIISDLKDFQVSSAQAEEIINVLKKSERKRTFVDNSSSPSKRRKSENKENLKLKIENSGFFPSPKKSGRFGDCIPNRSMGDQVRNRKNSIYIMTAVEKPGSEYVDYEDRINADVYFKKGYKLHEAFLAVEIKIRKLIKQNNLLYKRTVYTGLAGDVSDRARGHKNHIGSQEKKAAETKKLSSSRKLRWLDIISRRQMGTRMSAIIENLPDEHLKSFEVLVGHLFNATAKASTVLGDHEAYEEVKSYWSSEERKKKLSEEGLLSTVEDLIAEEEDFMLGFKPKKSYCVLDDEKKINFDFITQNDDSLSIEY